MIKIRTPSKINAMILPVSDAFRMSYKNSFKIVRPNKDNAIILRMREGFRIPIIKNKNDSAPYLKLAYQI